MPNFTLPLAGRPIQDPAIPPAGWEISNGSSAAGVIATAGYHPNRANGAWCGWSYAGNAIPDQDGFISASVTINATEQGRLTSYSAAITLTADDGSLYRLTIAPWELRFARIDSGGLNGTAVNVGGPSALTASTIGDVITMRYNTTTGELSAVKNGQAVANFTRTDTTHRLKSFKPGFAVNGYPGFTHIGSASVFDVPDPAVITAINNGQPIVVGQSSIIADHIGFSGSVASVVSNLAVVQTQIANGTDTRTTFGISDWVDGAEYPELDTPVRFTFIRPEISGSINTTIVAPAGYKKVVISSPIIDEERMLGYSLSQYNHVLQGAVLYYDTTDNPSFELLPDLTSASITTPLSFDIWLRPSQGDTRDRMFYFRASISELNAPRISNVIEFNGNSFGTAPTLGTIIGKKIRVRMYVKLTKEGGNIWGQRNNTGRECCLYVVDSTPNNPDLYFSYGMNNLIIGKMFALFGVQTTEGILDFEYSPITQIYSLKYNGVEVANGLHVGGTAHSPGTLWRIGAGGADNVSGSIASRAFLPSVNQIGDHQIWLDDVLVRDYVIPASGVVATDLVSGADMTLHNVAANELKPQKPKPFYPISRIVVIGASLVSRPLGTSLTLPSIFGTKCLMAAGLDGVIMYGYGHGGQAMNYIQTRIPLAVAAFPNDDTMFITELMGNDISAKMPRAFADLSASEITSLNNLMTGCLSGFPVRERNYMATCTFRTYVQEGFTDREIFNDESLGSKPYNDNILIPKLLPHELNVDGQPLFNPYTVIRNDFETLIDPDGIHHTDPIGETAFVMHLANTAKVLIVDGIKSPPIERRLGDFEDNVPTFNFSDWHQQSTAPFFDGLSPLTAR
jgi:hypothetical protein